jgi:hypothetical protein
MATKCVTDPCPGWFAAIIGIYARCHLSDENPPDGARDKRSARITQITNELFYDLYVRFKMGRPNMGKGDDILALYYCYEDGCSGGVNTRDAP